MTALQRTGLVCVTFVAAAADVYGQGRKAADDPALIVAAEHNDVPTMRRLLEAGADVRVRDAHSRTPLLAATAHNHIESAKLLIAAGAMSTRRTTSSIARCSWQAPMAISKFSSSRCRPVRISKSITVLAGRR